MSCCLENSTGRRALVAMAFTALVLGLGAPCAQSQRRVELISFTNTTWRFEASGADQGVAWRARTFDDASWPSGRGLFGFETTLEVYPFPFNTVFDPFNPNILTYYFRTHFEMPASDLAFPLTLICSNLVDDGFVVYLNSNEVQRIRVPTGQTFQTQAIGGPSAEGAIVGPVNISTNGLRVGDNVIAVEVHQAGLGSADVAFGLSLTAIVPTAVSITSQPQSQTTTSGVAVVLSVGVAGGPALYQWQTTNVSGALINVPGATSSSFIHTPTMAGTVAYQVVVSNGVNSVTSDLAIVTALADTLGPRMRSAVVLEEATRTNRIQITWNEGLLSSTVTAPQSRTNFEAIMLPSNLRVAVSNVQYNPGTFPLPDIPPTVTLTMSTTNWHVGSNYLVSVSNVKDRTGNVIAPDSRIAVSWPRTTNVIGSGHVWSFYSPFVFAPDIFDQPWTATNFVEDFFWGHAPGPFCKGNEPECTGSLCLSDIGFERQPALFRTTFVAPAHPAIPSRLHYHLIADDAVVLFLNGMELVRLNLPATPLTPQTKASARVCSTNADSVTVTKLFPGTNWLAAAVFQSSPADTHAAFSFAMDHTGFFPGSLPEVPIPQLNIAAEGANRFRLWWDGPGFALESTTNLVFTNGGAVGAWLEVTNMSNPFIAVLTGERRFFRLRQ